MAAQLQLRVAKKKLNPDGVVALLAEIFTDLARLPGAACIGRHEMFDPVLGNGRQYQRQEQIRVAEAARLCATCPVIRHCPSATVSTELKEPA